MPGSYKDGTLSPGWRGVYFYTLTAEDFTWMRLENAHLPKPLLSSKGIKSEIVDTEDSVRDWMLQTTSE